MRQLRNLYGTDQENSIYDTVEMFRIFLTYIHKTNVRAKLDI